MDVFPKFIIETDEELGDCLILSKVTFHESIAIFPEKVKGGGWFEFSTELNGFIFYGTSEQFGPAKLEDIQNCVDSELVFNDPYLAIDLSKYNFFYREANGTVIPLSKSLQK